MELLPGFAWPVPRAFAGAVSACRFEQGDVFYSDLAGYQTWATGDALPAHRIQVLDPPKTARALSAESDGKRFFANWTSSVELIVAEGAGKSEPSVVTTQGRLFTGLWRGELAWLDGEGEAPPPPQLQRDLHKRLSEAAEPFARRFAARLGEAARCLYLAAVDESSDASLVKAQGIESLLAEHVQGETERATPAELGLKGAEHFHPALVLHVVAVPGGDPAKIETMLSGLLYAGAGAGTEGGTGRFSLSRHGLLVVPADKEGEET